MNALEVDLGNSGADPRGSRDLWGMFCSIFLAYLAFAIVSAAVLHGVFVPFIHLAEIINLRLGRPAGNATGGYVAFFTFVIILTLLLAGLFGFLFRILRANQSLRYFALITTVVAAPVCWFYVTRWHGWLPLEVVAFSALVLVGVLAQRSIPLAAYVLGFSLHFAFWGLRFWQFTHNPAEVLLPFVGFCASIAWVSLNSRTQQSKS